MCQLSFGKGIEEWPQVAGDKKAEIVQRERLTSLVRDIRDHARIAREIERPQIVAMT